MKLKLYRLGLWFLERRKIVHHQQQATSKLFREKEKNILNNLKEKYIT
jgi:hypothetical protein